MQSKKVVKFRDWRGQDLAHERKSFHRPLFFLTGLDDAFLFSFLLLFPWTVGGFELRAMYKQVKGKRTFGDL